MTLDEWIVEEAKRVQSFKEHWEEQADKAKDPEQWPMEMTPGDWDEQYLAWNGVVL